MKDTGSSSNITDDKSQDSTEQGRDPISEGIDYLSQLPEEILFHVLSFLTLKESLAVSILQTKWKCILAKIPNLDFHEFEIVKAIRDKELFCNQHDGNPPPGSECCSMHLQQVARKKFTELVERTLLLHSGWPIVNLRLCFHYHVCDAYAKRIDSWIQFAFTNNIKNLKLEFSITDPLNKLDEESLRRMRRITKPNPQFVFPSDYSGPKGLETLKLRFCRLNATKFNTFGALRRLLFKYVKIIDCSIAELVRNCPVLEDLSLDTCILPKAFLLSEEDIRIKRLSVINSDAERRFGIDISTPYLLQLEIVEINFISVSIRNASQLVDATISTIAIINAPGVGTGDPLVSMLICLRNCHTLTLTTYNPRKYLRSDSHLPRELPTPLQNMKHLNLVAGLLQMELQRISCLLRSCPNLESLTITLHEPTPMGWVIDETPSAYNIEEDGHWESQTMPFPCLQNSLKRITVNKLEGSSIELQLIKFLAKNARVLEKMVIYPNAVNEYLSKAPQRMNIYRQQRHNLSRFLRFISTSFGDKVTIIRKSNF